MESWKQVVGYEGLYEISSIGQVRSVLRKVWNPGRKCYRTQYSRILKQTLDSHGYKRVTLSKDGNINQFLVHRLVAIAFIPNPNNYKYVNHKDENTMNNSAANLEWCTNSYNLIYSIGKKIAQYSKNGELIKTFNSIVDASREYNIPTTNISKCCKGKRHSAGKYIWKYVR